MGMGIGVGEGEGEGLRPEFTPYYRTPRKEAMQLKGENDDSNDNIDANATCYTLTLKILLLHQHL